MYYSEMSFMKTFMYLYIFIVYDYERIQSLQEVFAYPFILSKVLQTIVTYYFVWFVHKHEK